MANRGLVSVAKTWLKHMKLQTEQVDHQRIPSREFQQTEPELTGQCTSGINTRLTDYQYLFI